MSNNMKHLVNRAEQKVCAHIHSGTLRESILLIDCYKAQSSHTVGAKGTNLEQESGPVVESKEQILMDKKRKHLLVQSSVEEL